MEDYKANLADFIDEGLDKALKTALEQACLIVETEAKRKCPVDDGQLRQSITHEVKDNEGIIGTNVEYAPYVEIGTGIYSSKGTGRQTAWRYHDDKHDKWVTTRGQKPQPFLQPALDEHRDEVEKCFEGLI